MQNVIYNSYEGEVSKTNELQLKVTLPDNLIMAAKNNNLYISKIL